MGPLSFCPFLHRPLPGFCFLEQKDPGVVILVHMQGVDDRAQQLVLLVRRDFLEVISQAGASVVLRIVKILTVLLGASQSLTNKRVDRRVWPANGVGVEELDFCDGHHDLGAANRMQPNERRNHRPGYRPCRRWKNDFGRRD